MFWGAKVVKNFEIYIACDIDVAWLKVKDNAI